MKYLVDGRQITETEAEEIQERNQQIFDSVMNGSDFSKLLDLTLLLDITFTFGEEVEQAEKARRNKLKA